MINLADMCGIGLERAPSRRYYSCMTNITAALDACQEALDNAGSDLEHTDVLRLDAMRAAATALCDACDDDLPEEHIPLVEDLVSILDDATITSDDPAADAIVVRRLHAALGVAT